MPRSVHGLDGAPEWPALAALLPELQGRRVVDLGCGFGWFARWAAEHGAAAALGLDLSERMREWRPTAAQLQEHPAWAAEVDRPTFLLVRASVGGAG